MKKLSLGLAGILMPMLFMSCTNTKTTAIQEETETENLLGVSKPVFEKFVVVIEDHELPIYQKADKNSPILYCWTEDIESDMADVQYHWSGETVAEGYVSNECGVWEGCILAVLSEEGDFYKVNTLGDFGDIEVGYLPKTAVRDISTEPYTADVAEAVEWHQTMVIKDGKYKNLVLTDNFDELWGESIELGVLLDGCIAYPVGAKADCDVDVTLDKIKVSKEENYITFFFPKNIRNRPTSEGFEEIVDLKKLSEEQVGEICETLMSQKYDKVRFDYYVPDYGVTSVTTKK